MSESEFFGMPDLGHIPSIKDACREGCPEGRPDQAEAKVRESYQGAAQDLVVGIDPDLEADKENLQPLSTWEATLGECFRQCDGPLKNRFGLGRAVCGQAINERRERLNRGEQ